MSSVCHASATRKFCCRPIAFRKKKKKSLPIVKTQDRSSDSPPTGVITKASLDKKNFLKNMSARRQRIDLGDGNSKKRRLDNDGEGDETNYWTGLPFSQRYYSILEKRTKLPVYQFKKELIDKILENQCVVVEGETGKKNTKDLCQTICSLSLFFFSF